MPVNLLHSVTFCLYFRKFNEWIKNRLHNDKYLRKTPHNSNSTVDLKIEIKTLNSSKKFLLLIQISLVHQKFDDNTYRLLFIFVVMCSVSQQKLDKSSCRYNQSYLIFTYEGLYQKLLNKYYFDSCNKAIFSVAKRDLRWLTTLYDGIVSLILNTAIVCNVFLFMFYECINTDLQTSSQNKSAMHELKLVIESPFLKW